MRILRDNLRTYVAIALHSVREHERHYGPNFKSCTHQQLEELDKIIDTNEPITVETE
jgi:hypothetical protein